MLRWPGPAASGGLAVAKMVSLLAPGSSGAGASLGPYKGRVTAVGGTIGYNLDIAGTPVSTRLKIMREVSVDNRAQGTSVLVSVAFPLGPAPSPKPAPEPRVVKH